MAYFLAFALTCFLALVPAARAQDAVPAPAGWFNTERLPTAVASLLFAATLLFFIRRARSGKPIFVRRIAGLEAVDEAVGRATEMGRPILYCPGLDPMEEVATVASINILGQVARKAGAYETRLIMPNCDPIVMTVAQEVVREAYSEVGRPDLFDPNDIYYTTQSQFGYAAAVCGTMMRDRPATNFFIGHFYAESLVLAETGNATGAIQIAGHRLRLPATLLHLRLRLHADRRGTLRGQRLPLA